MAAYLGVAYDLYIVEDNNCLRENLIERLKHREQFQGARHELFAEATCLRAGFSVKHEDETDGLRRHVEFVATHKRTSLQIAVEAKSRHRPGVIAHAGTPQPDEQVDFKFSRLINDAIAKQSGCPLAIFVDTNLPPRRAGRFFVQSYGVPRPSKYVSSIIEALRAGNENRATS